MAPHGKDTGTDPEHDGGSTNPIQPGNETGLSQEVLEVGAEEKDVRALISLLQL